MLSDYIFTPRDFWDLGKSAISKFRAKDLLGLIILFLAFELFWWFLAVSGEALIFVFFIVILFYWRIDSRVSISLALAGLIAVVLLLIMEKFNLLALGDEAANKVAVWTFYFLAIGVAKQMWENYTDRTEEKGLRIEEDERTEEIGLRTEEGWPRSQEISVRPQIKKPRPRVARKKFDL